MTNFKKYLPALAALMLMSACDIRLDYHVYNEASYQRMIDEKDEGSMVPASSEGTCTPAPMQEMPLSKTYLMGVLDNGLSYYVEYMTNLDKCNGRPYHTQDKRAIKGVTPSKLRRFAQTLISKGYKHELAIVGQQE